MTHASILRALHYPYDIPDDSYVVENGRHRPFTKNDQFSCHKGRVPVLAAGSNQSPTQLLHKFSKSDWGSILCEKAIIEDFDAVYSAHISAYGAIPAALFPSPGTITHVILNWLDPDQLSHMHHSEVAGGNYEFAELSDIKIQSASGKTRKSIHFYRTSHGALTMNAHPVALSEITATNRQFPTLSQLEIQTHLKNTLDAEASLDDFITTSINNALIREDRKQQMQKCARRFYHPARIDASTK